MLKKMLMLTCAITIVSAMSGMLSAQSNAVRVTEQSAKAHPIQVIVGDIVLIQGDHIVVAATGNSELRRTVFLDPKTVIVRKQGKKDVTGGFELGSRVVITESQGPRGFVAEKIVVFEEE